MFLFEVLLPRRGLALILLYVSIGTTISETIDSEVRSNEIDQGYDAIFESNYETIHDHAAAVTSGKIPDEFLGKEYLLQGVGGFDFNNMSFQMVLDGFGKVYRFRFEQSAIRFDANMLRSEWYNASEKLGYVAPGLLFAETIPPRPKCNILSDAMCNVKAANDNDYVLALKMGTEYFLTTDNPVYLHYNPDTLATSKWTFAKGDLKKPLMNMISMGAAHTVPAVRFDEDDEEDSYIGVAMSEPDMMMGSATLYVYRIRASEPDKREALNTVELPRGYYPYIHAFGITKNYVILSLQPVTMKLSMETLYKGTLDSAIHDFDATPRTSCRDCALANSLVAVPLNGSSVRVFPMNASAPEFSVHVANAYETEEGDTVVMDYCSFPSMPFRDPLQLLSTRRNKTARDASRSRSQIHRATLHLAGERAGDVDIREMTQPPHMTEFVVIDPAFHGKRYCVVFGLEFWHDEGGKTQGAIAVKRTNLCDNTTTYWYRENVYPSEPVFVARSGSTNEGDGYLLFVALDGAEKVSRTHIVDATTLKDVAAADLPFTLPFTAHGRVFDL